MKSQHRRRKSDSSGGKEVTLTALGGGCLMLKWRGDYNSLVCVEGPGSDAQGKAVHDGN